MPDVTRPDSPPRHSRRFAALLPMLIVLQAAAAQALEPVGDEAFALLSRWFDYASSPTEPRADELRPTPQGMLYKIVFSGGRDRRLPAHLELPLHAQAPYPCILLIHDMSRSKESWWSFGQTTEGKLKDRLVTEGFAVLSLDLPLHGERAVENDFLDPGQLLRDQAEPQLRDMFVDGVIDQRRALDALATRSDIDTERIGVLGYGIGGSVAIALTALESRVRATVACVPPTVQDGLSVRAVQNYAPRVHTPVFLLTATNSRTSSTADGEQLADLLDGVDTEHKIYTSDDRLPIWYVGDAVTWLSARLLK